MGSSQVAEKEPSSERELILSKLEATTQRPESIDFLIGTTKFSRKEIKLLYRGFKEACPNGVIDIRKFKESFFNWFPNGDSSDYAQYVFDTFDGNHDGYINFQEFLSGLSVLMRGTTREKLRWIFNLYDLRRDNVLTKDELHKIVISVHEMTGASSGDSTTTTWPPFNNKECLNHAIQIFNRLDEGMTGYITWEMFCDHCENDPTICSSLHDFDSILYRNSSPAILKDFIV